MNHYFSIFSQKGYENENNLILLKKSGCRYNLIYYKFFSTTIIQSQVGENSYGTLTTQILIWDSITMSGRPWICSPFKRDLELYKWLSAYLWLDSWYFHCSLLGSLYSYHNHYAKIADHFFWWKPGNEFNNNNKLYQWFGFSLFPSLSLLMLNSLNSEIQLGDLQNRKEWQEVMSISFLIQGIERSTSSIYFKGIVCKILKSVSSPLYMFALCKHLEAFRSRTTTLDGHKKVSPAAITQLLKILVLSIIPKINKWIWHELMNLTWSDISLV